ncbi:unnamed protein product [Orchesella dallaii]|uniref:Uncharacterized protein n=1 Tax=Orchesella dallaii TaxID=48710 RepID=A0ABP1S6F2_9HEXA
MDETSSIGMSDGSGGGGGEEGGSAVTNENDAQNHNSTNNDTTTSNASGGDEKNPVTANNLGDLVAAAVAPKRYLQVEGFDGRRNDIVYCRPLTTLHEASNAESDTDAQSSGLEEDKQKVMLFFGGDIQDFPEMMEQHRDHRNYVAFNLEATAVMLQKQFPDHHVAVVRPSRIQMLTFSCYDNFVHCNHTGAPEHVITHHSLHHLELLLQNLSKRIAKGDEPNPTKKSLEDGTEKVEGNDEDSTVSSTTVDELATQQRNKNNVLLRLDRAWISLVGFSKGCVVLNQLLYEFHYLKTLTPDDLSMDDFLSCIKDMYWLDGGHNGGKNTWITSRSLLETLTRLEVRIHVHLTPYQLLDDRRPWIRKEEKLFSELLKKFNAPIIRRIHFENEPASLLQHLRIIGDFASEEKPVEVNHENNMEH